MSPKEYLLQVQTMDEKIRQRQQQLSELKATMYGLKGSSIGEKVQSSTVGDAAFVHSIERMEAIEREISTLVANYVEKKNLIISQIQRLGNRNYMDLLYKRYVEYKRLKLIAVEMHYSFVYIRRMHGWALLAFNRIILEGGNVKKPTFYKV